MKTIKKMISAPKELLKWLVLFSALMTAVVVFYYGDLGCTLENAVLLVDAIKDGEFLHYYDYSIKHVTSYWAANYDLPIYIIFAIWNIPVILARWIFGLSVTSGWALLWCKGLVAVSTIGCGGCIYKICRKIEKSEENSLIACFLFLSSLNVAIPAFLTGQYDSIGLFFMLLGLYYYIGNQQKKFFACFMLAVPLKMFALFMFIPLLLLKEKRVIYILGKTLIVCLPWAAFKLLFYGDPAYRFAVGSQSEDGLLKLLEGSEGMSGQAVSIFVAVLIIICIYCYLKKEEEKELSIYVSFWVFLAFILFVSISDYWIILAAPFVIMVIMMNPQNYFINIVIETVASGAYLIFAFIEKTYPYNYPDLVKKLMIPHFMDTPTAENAMYGTASGFLKEVGMDKFSVAFYTIFWAGMLALGIINRPGIKTKPAEDNIKKIKEYHYLICLRNVSLFAVIGLLLYANLKTTNLVAFTTLQAQPVNVAENLLVGNEFTQELTFDQDTKLEELQVYFVNRSDSRDNMSSVVLEFVRKSDSAVLVSERVGCSMIPSETPVKIKLHKAPVQKNEAYYIRITGIPGVTGVDNYISPKAAAGFSGALEPARLNGEEQSYHLYFQIR